MFNTNLKVPHILNGWGEGQVNNLVKSIFSCNHFQLDKPENFHFEECLSNPLFLSNCTKESLENPNLALKKLAEICSTTPKKILLIETQRVMHARRAYTFFRFYHHYLNDRHTEFCRYVRAELPFRNPWASETPTLFYQIAIEKTAVKTGCSNEEAQFKIDNLLACLFNNYDFIFDLANSRVYKRMLCNDLELCLRNLRHLESVIIFSQKELRTALLEQIPNLQTEITLNPHTTTLEVYDHTRRKFTKLNKDTIEHKNVKHFPYAAEHNYLIVRMKYGKCAITFLVYMPMFERKFLNNEDININSVIPFMGVNQDAERLKEYYMSFTRGRIVDSPVASLSQ